MRPLCTRAIILPQNQNLHGEEIVRITADFSSKEFFGSIDMSNPWNDKVGATLRERVSRDKNSERSDPVSRKELGVPSVTLGALQRSEPLPCAGMRVGLACDSCHKFPVDLRKATDALPCAGRRSSSLEW